MSSQVTYVALVWVFYVLTLFLVFLVAQNVIQMEWLRNNSSISNIYGIGYNVLYSSEITGIRDFLYVRGEDGLSESFIEGCGSNNNNISTLIMDINSNNGSENLYISHLDGLYISGNNTLSNTFIYSGNSGNNKIYIEISSFNNSNYWIFCNSSDSCLINITNNENDLDNQIGSICCCDEYVENTDYLKLLLKIERYTETQRLMFIFITFICIYLIIIIIYILSNKSFTSTCI